MAGSEGGLGVVFWKEDGDVVGGFALPQEPAYALKVFVDLRHEWEPGVVGAEDGCGVEAPAGLGGRGWRVGVAVADELIDAEEEHAVGFSFHIERGGAEGGGMQPGPGLGGGDVAVVEMACGCGPTGEGELTPSRAFSFGEVGEGFVGESDGGFAVSLRAEEGVVGFGELGQWREVVFADEIGEGLAPVVADGFGLRGASCEEFGEVRDEVVAAALSELSREIGGPVGAVDFKGVGEDGVGRLIAEGVDQGRGDVLKMLIDGGPREMVEDEAFGSVGGALYGLAGVAGDEVENRLCR